MSFENKYNIDSVQVITDRCLPGYKVLEVKRISNGSKYGHKWKVLLKCPNKEHEPYWTELQVIKHKHPCRKCIEEAEYLTPRKHSIVLSACEKNNCKFIQVIPSNKKRFQSIILKIEDKDGYWYNVSLDHLRNRKMNYTYKFESNPYALHNIKIWCKLNRPEYEFCSDSFNKMSDIYKFQYNGDEISLSEQEKIFTMTMSNFIYDKGIHPLLKQYRKSYGSYLVREFLRVNNVLYIEEKTWDDLLSKRKAHLFVDFYLPEYNLIIEVDGIQHFEPVIYFGGQKSFDYLKENDKIKNEYCEKHNIHLLRVPYYLYGTRREPNTEYLNILRDWIRIE